MRKKRSYPKKRGGPTTLRPGIDTLEVKETPAGKEETIEMDAEVVEPLPNAMFKVKLQTGQTILAYTSGPHPRPDYLPLQVAPTLPSPRGGGVRSA